MQRIFVDGKFLQAGNRRFWVKGVTYGTFAPDDRGRQFPPSPQVRRDFAAMARAGANTVRVYTPPSRAMLDDAAAEGLRVIVGPAVDAARGLPRRSLPGRRDPPRHRPAGPHARRSPGGADVRPRQRGAAERRQVARAGSDRAVPAHLVRRRPECRARCAVHVRQLSAHRAISICRPSTSCRSTSTCTAKPQLRAYLANLQNIAGHKPLLLAEAGADSIREGLDGQAAITAMHVRAAFEEGACGAVAYAWTDEWWRGGAEIDDWNFGLVDRERAPQAGACRRRTGVCRRAVRR